MDIEFKCLNCLKQSSAIRFGKQNPPKYCCVECYLEHKKAKVTLYGVSNCEKCGKVFKWKRPKHQGPAKLCSNKCKPKYYSEKESLDHQIKMYNERVVKNTEGCWGWTGTTDSTQGYSRIRNKRKNISAHRISWIIHRGEIPEGKQINHHCDNRRCTNPYHLYLGTQQENDADRMKRNRQAKGSRNAAAKLNEQQVLEIKKNLKQGFSYKEIQEIYHISNATVSNISTEKNWKHVILPE